MYRSKHERETWCVRARARHPEHAQTLAFGSHGSMKWSDSNVKTCCIHRCLAAGVARELRFARPLASFGANCFFPSGLGCFFPRDFGTDIGLFVFSMTVFPYGIDRAAKSALILPTEPEELFSGLPGFFAYKSELEEFSLRANALCENSSRSHSDQEGKGV